MPSIEAILGLVMATQPDAEKAKSGLRSAENLMVTHTDVSVLAKLLHEADAHGRMGAQNSSSPVENTSFAAGASGRSKRGHNSRGTSAQ